MGIDDVTRRIAHKHKEARGDLKNAYDDDGECVQIDENNSYDDDEANYDPLEQWKLPRAKKIKKSRPGWVQDVDERLPKINNIKATDKSASSGNLAKDLYYSEKLRLMRDLHELKCKTESEKLQLIEEQIFREKYERKLTEKWFDIKIHCKKEKYKYYKRSLKVETDTAKTINDTENV